MEEIHLPKRKSGIVMQLKACFAIIFLICGVLLYGCSSVSQDSAKGVKDGQVPGSTDRGDPRDGASGVPAGLVIPELVASDIRRNLEPFGMLFTGPQAIENSDESLDEGKGTDPDSGVEFSTTITTIDVSKVRAVTFSTRSEASNGTVAADVYAEAAKDFLGFGATLPYKDNDPEAARAWVRENVGNVNSDDPVTTTIGSVEFRLSAENEFNHFLSMRPK